MLQILPNGQYNVTIKADADTRRGGPALVTMTGGVLVIGGDFYRIKDSVSKYDITTNTW